MGLATGIAVYILIWWTVLFAILPIGVRTQSDEEEVIPGTEAGAPVRARHLYKFVITSLVSVVVWVIIDIVVRTDVFNFSVYR